MASRLQDRCPSCGAPRLPMPACPECRVPYPPAEGSAGAAPRGRPAAPGGGGGSSWGGEAADARLEWRLRLLAPPIVLLVAFLAMRSGAWRSLSRIFLSMWIHELGHTVAAWLTGFNALPGPWRTWIADGRSVPFVLVLSGALAAGATVAWLRTRRAVVPTILGALLTLQLGLTLLPGEETARAFITFAGDGGQLVLGTLLMATFFVPPETSLHRTWLRWGFLVIGAFAFMDAFASWAEAARDLDSIPFGELEGIGTSDPTRLVDDHGWTPERLVRRYGLLRWTCLAAFAALWAWDVWRRRDDARA